MKTRLDILTEQQSKTIRKLDFLLDKIGEDLTLTRTVSEKESTSEISK